VHDNFLYAIAANFDEKVLILHTEYRDGDGPYELTDVRFLGLVAFHFEDAASPSILLDISEHSAEEIIREWGDLLESRRNWSWPINFSDLSDLSGKLAKLGVMGYNIHGTVGINGFILASSSEYRTRDTVITFN
jgi:hypothetical protein